VDRAVNHRVENDGKQHRNKNGLQFMHTAFLNQTRVSTIIICRAFFTAGFFFSAFSLAFILLMWNFSVNKPVH
jgi:hypothetical protein